MKITIPNKSRQNADVFMRKCGYKPWRNPHTGEESYIRRLSGAFYPRFHATIGYDSAYNFVLDIHFDARRPMHKRGITTSEGTENPAFAEEIERIKRLAGA